MERNLRCDSCGSNRLIIYANDAVLISKCNKELEKIARQFVVTVKKLT